MDELTREQVTSWRDSGWNDDCTMTEADWKGLCNAALAYLSAKEGREGAMVEGAEVILNHIKNEVTADAHSRNEDEHAYDGDEVDGLDPEAIIRASLAEKGGVE